MIALNPVRYFSVLGLCLGILVFSCKTPPVTSSKTEPTPIQKSDFDIIAYYSGTGEDLDQYHWEQLDQVIYSFCHLRGNRLAVDSEADSLVIKKLVSLKKKYRNLKVLVSLGGWGGCKTCSEVFSSSEARTEFSGSVNAILNNYKADGIDLDWEYPAIEGVPGHPYSEEDRHNFTLLVQELRDSLGAEKEISFAAGGFPEYIDQSIEWELVMPKVNRVNLMSYDLVGGYSTTTGHHTPLYSNDKQVRSVDNGVKCLLSKGVPPQKIVIGAAFYARVWKDVENINTGLYQLGTFKSSVPYKKFDDLFAAKNGFDQYRDFASQAAFAYSPSRREFATFDDTKTVQAKTIYAKNKGLGGIMFWELRSDLPEGGLLNDIFLSSGKKKN